MARKTDPAVDLELSDILGQPTLPNVPAAPSTALFAPGRLVATFAVLLALYLAVRRIRKQVLLAKEKAYKLETRRRHGIPDNDRRPFTVAYAAATIAREEREKNARLARPPTQPRPTEATAETPALRNRNTGRQPSASNLIPGSFHSYPDAQDDLTHNSPSHVGPGGATAQSNTSPNSSFNRASRRARARDSIRQQLDSVPENPHDAAQPKEDDMDQDLPRGAKRGLDHAEYEEGDDTGLDEEVGGRDKRQKRNSAYIQDDQDQDMYEEEEVSEGGEMDIDESQDDVYDLPSVAQLNGHSHGSIGRATGKKRNRAEAGSTFGGDYDDEDVDSAPEEAATKAGRNRRKRRTFAKRKSEVAIAFPSRKRDRDADWEDDVLGAPSESSRTSRRQAKKNRRHSTLHDSHMDDSDGSLASSRRSAQGKKRHIGEEWEANGIRYKIGPNWQRLRQDVVKKARSKFNMPKDSEHADRDAHMEVYVECWMTEEEYRDAKENGRLAWQDRETPTNAKGEAFEGDLADAASPTGTSATADSSTTQTTNGKATKTDIKKPAREGKDLLWHSTSKGPSSSSRHATPFDAPVLPPRGLRARYAHGVGNASSAMLPLPLPASALAQSRRVSSYTSAGLPSSLASSVSGSGPSSPSGSAGGSLPSRARNLSKWEKQEAEAEAIRKLRALQQGEAAAKAQQEKAAKEEVERKEWEKKERERIEREVREKVEKEHREKMEKEQKEKEAKAKSAAAAAAAAAPSVTAAPPKLNLGAPVAVGSDAGKPAGNPLFGFGAPPAPSAATTTTAAPGSTNSAKPNPLFGGIAPPAPSTSQAGEAKFGFPSAAPTAAPTKVEEKKPTSSGFSFAAPPATNGGTSSLFPAAPAAKPTEPTMTGNAAGGSLLSRMGSGAAPATTSVPAPSAFSFAKPAGATGFGFGAGPAAAPPATVAPTTATTSTESTTGAASAAGGLKFNFGGPSKPAAPAPAPAAPATETKPSFSFGAKPATTGAAASPFGAPATTAPDASKNAFGGFGSAPSVFGSGAASSGGAFGATPAAPAATGGSSMFGAKPAMTTTTTMFGGGGSSAFGAQDKGKETAKPPTSFGGSGGAFSFGAKPAGSSTGGAFGAPATTSTTPSSSSSAFSFGAPSSTSMAPPETPVKTNILGANTTTTTTAAPAASAIFGGGKGSAFGAASSLPTTTPAGKPGGFSFNFGGGAGGSSSSGSGGASSGFGSAAGPSAFGFGTPVAQGGAAAPGSAASTTPAGVPTFNFGKK